MNDIKVSGLLVAAMCAALSVGTLGCGGDDDGGGADAATGGDPTASFTASPTCTSSSSTAITFTSTSTDPDGQALTCAWTFSSCTNGSCSSTQCTQAGITFPNAAPYPVTLIVTDPDGNTDSMSMNIGPC